MAKWVRELTRPEGTLAHWHILATEKEFAVAHALCGERFPSAVEAASSDEKLRREGRCPACESVFATKQKEALVGRR